MWILADDSYEITMLIFLEKTKMLCFIKSSAAFVMAADDQLMIFLHEI